MSLFGTFPLIGDSLIEWIRGDYFISDITMNRFFALHVVALPLVLISSSSRTSLRCTKSARTIRKASKSGKRRGRMAIRWTA